jgi:hypothetical protein
MNIASRWKVFFAALCFAQAVAVMAQPAEAVKGALDWEKMEISLEVSLDLAQSGYRLPAGRTASEAELGRRYPTLARPVLEALPVNSSATVGGYLEEGRLEPWFPDEAAAMAVSVPPFLSTDFRSIRSIYSLSLTAVAALIPPRQNAVLTVPPLNPVDAGTYTGIIVIADEELPVHGKRSTALPLPSFAPRLWDSDMELLFDRSKTQSGVVPFHYMNAGNILSSRPGGLSPAAEAVVGASPLRIIAGEVFGEHPTDLVIAAEDAKKILANEDNRRLLREGKLAIILNETVLKSAF